MTEYYFDIETYSTPGNPDPCNDKIITIQYQKIDLRTGKPKDKLIILKEWELSEERIISKFYNEFFRKDLSKWNFIAVGCNLNFEWEFLIAKFEKYLGIKLSSRVLHYKRPHIDLKSILILLNSGKFIGASLDKFTNKPPHGKLVSKWYENKQYDKIEQYIRSETEAFLEFLHKITKNIHRLLE
ncbi:MAG: ribonuclease H-like domain-containing protein [Promethearchaeota archaeon]